MVVLLIIVLSIPLTVLVVQQQQDIRQEAAAGSTFRSIDTNKCGSIIEPGPAVGVTTGIITWKAPIKVGTEWKTVKPDGTEIPQDKMKEAYVGEVRNGEAIGAEGRAAVWDTTVVSQTHINCNTFINITLDGDCTVEFVNGIGSTDHPVGPGGTVQLRFTVDPNRTGGFCRKLINVETDAGGTTPTITGTITPTVTLTGTITPTGTQVTPTVSVTRTPTLTSTPTPTLTRTPTPTISLTPTIPKTPTLLTISVLLPGIGKSGNSRPNNMERKVFVSLFDTTNKTIGASVSGALGFDPTSGVFKGTVNFGTIVPSGNYTTKIHVDQYLNKIIAANSALIAGVTTTLPQVALITGDINSDNKLDMLDYNMLVGCFGNKINSDSCGNRKVDADLNDDGIIDGTDYNLFVRNVRIAKQGE